MVKEWRCIQSSITAKAGMANKACRCTQGSVHCDDIITKIRMENGKIWPGDFPEVIVRYLINH